MTLASVAGDHDLLLGRIELNELPDLIGLTHFAADAHLTGSTRPMETPSYYLTGSFKFESSFSLCVFTCIV